jgi:hypothetical protein
VRLLRTGGRRLAWAFGAGAAAIFIASGALAGDIVNGDFQAGNVGFGSDYSYVAPVSNTVLFPEGLYTVANNPNSVHLLYGSFYDHTLGTSAGQMMILNGYPAPGKRVWYENGITVTPDTRYDFGAWLASNYPANPARLGLYVNGALVGSGKASSLVGLWTPVSASWSSGSNTTADLSIIDLNASAAGNDFSIDDVSLGPPGPPPPAEINLATGLDGGGHLQFANDSLDAWWQVTGAVDPLNPPNAYVVGVSSPDNGFCCGWPPDGPSSSWIAANPDDQFGNGLMTFTRTFTVNDPSTAQIVDGAWSPDDYGSLLLNGHVLSSFTSGAPWLSMHAFSADPSDFVAGLNTLTIELTQSDFNRDGARLQGILEGDVSGGPPVVPPSSVPEPSGWTAILIGFAVLGARMRRLTRRPAATP